MANPRSHSQFLEYANFVCKFGQDLNLLDLAEEVVLPAFFDRQLSRDSSRSRLFFHRVEIVEVQTQPEVVLALSGRLVKQTSYVSEQKYNLKTDEIETSDDKIDAAPSSFFMLTLNDHRMVYMPETGNAPGIKAFETTIRKFIKTKYDSFIQTQYDAGQESRKQDPSAPRLTKVELAKRYPVPTVDVIPLSTPDLVNEFMDRFRLIRTVDFKILPPNDDEIDGNSFFGELQEERAAFESKDTHFNLENPEGLNPDVAEERIGEALATGNVKVNFSGTGEGGERIDGDEVNLRVREEFPFDTRGPVVSVVTVAKQMFDKIKSALTTGRITLEAQPANPEKVAQDIDVLRRQQVQWNQLSRAKPVEEVVPAETSTEE